MRITDDALLAAIEYDAVCETNTCGECPLYPCGARESAYPESSDLLLDLAEARGIDISHIEGSGT
jgi:hypothetical protein